MRDRLIFGLTLVWKVAFSVTATVLLSIPLFGLDIGWEKLTDVAGMSSGRLMHNYLVLMEYLLNPFRTKLKMPDFPDSAGALKHFGEVKVLFLLVLILTLVLIPIVIKFYREHLQILFHRGIIIAMVLPVLLALFAATVGFDSFFVLFHQILFRDTTWLFDPATDPIINVLTDTFFMYCFIIFAIIYEGVMLISLLLSSNKFSGKLYGKKKS
ncbi:TIGR01906 family membrane protein [Lactovum odontotermitis]